MKDEIPTGKKLKQLKKESTGIIFLGIVSMACAIIAVPIAQLEILSMLWSGSRGGAHSPLLSYALFGQAAMILGMLVALYLTKKQRMGYFIVAIYAFLSLAIWQVWRLPADWIWSPAMLVALAIATPAVASLVYVRVVKSKH